MKWLLLIDLFNKEFFLIIFVFIKCAKWNAFNTKFKILNNMLKDIKRRNLMEYRIKEIADCLIYRNKRFDIMSKVV